MRNRDRLGAARHDSGRGPNHFHRNSDPVCACPACDGQPYGCRYCEDGTVKMSRVDLVERKAEARRTEKIGCPPLTGKPAARAPRQTLHGALGESRKGRYGATRGSRFTTPRPRRTGTHRTQRGGALPADVTAGRHPSLARVTRVVVAGSVPAVRSAPRRGAFDRLLITPRRATRTDRSKRKGPRLQPGALGPDH